MSFLEIRFSGRYKAQSLICKTKQKSIYRGRNIQTGQLVVIKAQFFKSKSSNILYEGKFLQMTQGSPGIPWMHWCGPQSDECNCLIVQHLGFGMEQLFQLCNRKFSLKTVTMIGLQLLQMLQVYHFKQLIHRNVCPHSFQLGKGRKNHRLHFNDLLNSKKYIDNKTGQHILKREALVPEVYNLFNSMNVLKGEEPSRRDDLESMMLMLVYFLKGDLPWLGIVEENHIQMGEKILNMRRGIPVAELMKGCPPEFTAMWMNIASLKFEEKPNYHFLQKKLKKIQTKNNIDNDYVFDWILQGIAQNEQLQVANIEQSPVNCQIIPNQDVFLKLFYEPYEKDLELNEIQKKFRSKKTIELQQSSMANNSQVRHEQRTDRRASRNNHDKQCLLF